MTARTGATFSFATTTTSSSSSAPFAPPKARLSRDEAREFVAKKEEEKTKARKLREGREAEEIATVESQYRHEIDVCPRCSTRFLTAGGFSRHYAAGCRSYTTNEVRERRRRERSVALRLATLDELFTAQHNQRIQDLATVKVKLTAPKDRAAPIGIVLEEQKQGDKSAFVVSSVAGLALESARVQAGYFIVQIGDGSAAISGGSLSGHLPAGGKLDVTFRRPRPAIQLHGSARETIHKEPRFVLHEQQEAYLNDMVLAPLQRGEQPMRPISVFYAMKSTFGNKIREDTRTPMWLEKEQISKWIAEQKKEEKQKRQEQKRAMKGSTDSEPPAKKPAGGKKGKGKGKKKAGGGIDVEDAGCSEEKESGSMGETESESSEAE